MNSTALLVIGAQREYFPGGRLPLAEPEQALDQILRLLGWARHQGCLVIHILRGDGGAGSPFFVPGSPGVQMHPDVTVLPGELLLEKRWPGAFTGTGLERILQERRVQRLILCGFQTHLCCDTTAREGVHRGFQVTVAADACGTRDLRIPGGGGVIAPMLQAATLAALADGVARILSTDELLDGKE